MKLPDAIKWCAHNNNLFSLFVHCLRYRIIWQTYQTLRILYSAVTLIFKQITYCRISSYCNSLHTSMFLTWVKARPQHRELCALSLTNSVWVLLCLTELRFERIVTQDLQFIVLKNHQKEANHFAGVVTKAAVSPQLFLRPPVVLRPIYRTLTSCTRILCWATKPQVRNPTHSLTHSDKPWWHYALRASL